MPASAFSPELTWGAKWSLGKAAQTLAFPTSGWRLLTICQPLWRHSKGWSKCWIWSGHEPGDAAHDGRRLSAALQSCGHGRCACRSPPFARPTDPDAAHAWRRRLAVFVRGGGAARPNQLRFARCEPEPCDGRRALKSSRRTRRDSRRSVVAGLRNGRDRCLGATVGVGMAGADGTPSQPHDGPSLCLAAGHCLVCGRPWNFSCAMELTGRDGRIDRHCRGSVVGACRPSLSSAVDRQRTAAASAGGRVATGIRRDWFALSTDPARFRQCRRILLLAWVEVQNSTVLGYAGCAELRRRGKRVRTRRRLGFGWLFARRGAGTDRGDQTCGAARKPRQA